MKLTHVSLLLATCGMLLAAEDAAKRLDDSADMLTEIMSAPDKGIPQDLLAGAQCVVLVPVLKKGAFIVGAMLALDAVSVSLSIVIPLATLLWLVALGYLLRAAFATARGERYELPRWLCLDLLR